MTEISKLKQEFCKRNRITDDDIKSERYLINLENNIDNFLKSSQLKENPEVEGFIIESLEKDYIYYTRKSFKDFYNNLFKFVEDKYTNCDLDLASCKFAPILNKNPYKYNSSEHMTTLFMEEKNIDNYYREKEIKEIIAFKYRLNNLEEKLKDQEGKNEKSEKEIKDYEEELSKLKVDIPELKRKSGKNALKKSKKIEKKIKRIQANITRINGEISKRADKKKFLEANYQILEENLKEKKKDIVKKLNETEFLVLLDDFSGSGETVLDYLESLKEYLPHNIKVIVGCLHIMSDAKEKLEAWININKEMTVLLYFERQSNKFFKNPKFGKNLGEISDLKEKLYNFEKKFVCVKEEDEVHILGYNDSQALVTNYRNTPNNTFSLFWKRKKNNRWRPLFPRNEKQGIQVYNPYSTKERKNIRKNVRKKVSENIKINPIFPEIIEHKKLIGVTIFLIYVRQNDRRYFENEDNSIVFDLIKGYNDNALQDCLNYDLIIDCGGFFELGTKGENYLNDIGLSDCPLYKLKENPTFQAADALKPGESYIPKIKQLDHESVNPE